MAPPTKLPTRKLGKNGPEISALGFGLMGLSVAYGAVRSDEERLDVLDRAWELGCTNWDTSDMYGDNLDLLGKWFALHPERRADIFLASKFGLTLGATGITIDSSPKHCRAVCEESLQRLGIDHIDLYYAHRVDAKTPIERTIEEMVKLKNEGKIHHIGLSACHPSTVRRAHAIHAISAYQVEYSPWALDIEGLSGHNLLACCRELGIIVFAYSPLGRGIMTGQIRSPADFDATDLRRYFPRFSEENFPKNLKLVDRMEEMAEKKECTVGQLTLAWVLKQGEDIVPIPGTKKIHWLEENVKAVEVTVTDEEDRQIRAWIEECGFAGERVPPGMLDEFQDTPPLEG